MKPSSSANAAPDAVPIGQHNSEIEENARLWEAKPLLHDVYGELYRQIASRIDRSVPGLIIEIGSGMGNVKKWIPDCVTTDLFSNPWLDRVENIYDLRFEDESAAAFILFDVWHHLQYPGAALRELHRVLKPRGRVIVLEPDMSLLGRFIYGFFHHEPLRLREPITWNPPPDFDPGAQSYYAAQGNCARIFGRGECTAELKDWSVIEVAHFPSLAYVGSGGFRGPQLYPRNFLPVVRFVEKMLAPFPALFSTRMLVVLEKNAGRV